MSGAIARLARDVSEVDRLRRWNVEHPPEQGWTRVAALAVSEYERAVGLVRR